MMRIVTVDRSNFEKVLPLIADYQRFYECKPDEERNRRYFSQFIEDHEQGILFVALSADDEALGFSTLYFVPSSLSAQTSCTFNDLYALPDSRGRGVALALGFHALRYASEHGFKSAWWLTKPDNKDGHRIYDTIASRSDWHMYEATLAGHKLGEGETA
jgi:GNAT superfamily N-acetyltransferase